MPAVTASNTGRYGFPGRAYAAAGASGNAFREFSAGISRAQELTAISASKWRDPDGLFDSYLDDAALSRFPADLILAEIDKKLRHRRRAAAVLTLTTLVALAGLIATPALTC